MAFDFKKEYKELYGTGIEPVIIKVPPISYAAVRGKGDPNAEDGEYQKAIAVLYAISYTLKMSYKGAHRIPGFYEYVVPPLEGFWWQEGKPGNSYTDKSAFHWISLIRLPEFVTKEEFDWAVSAASEKKKMDCSVGEYLTIEEGLCAQILHVGSFDTEAETISRMDACIKEKGYVNDIRECADDIGRMRLHHEIYLTDVRKVLPEKWRTIIRHPVR
ncbi:MAG: GyrI-like domain-containing protein [Ruminococcus sp.]|nr:GyrI-like domain-containing protein [Ruminococcus sp.]